MLFQAAIFLLYGIFYTEAACNTLEWIGGPIEFPNEETKILHKSNGSYASKNIIATRAQIYEDDVYVALPKYKQGVPVTLAKIGLKSKRCEPILMPYPNWTVQETTLQNVADIFVDPHGILWALDIGVVNTLEDPIRKCPPKVVAFDLKTNELVRTLDLSGLVVQASRLQYILADYGSDGKPFVYITDAATRSLLVFDVSEGRNYRLVLPKAVLGSRRDVLYAALVRKGCGHNILIITYLSGSRIYSIQADQLRSGSVEGRIRDLGDKLGKIILLGTDGGAGLFYRYEGESDVYQWDSDSGLFDKGDSVYRSPDCYLATEVLPDIKRNRMMVLESNFPDYIQGTVGCGVSQRISSMDGNVAE